MAKFNRGQVVKYKGRPYVYFSTSKFLKDKHMIAAVDPKSNKVLTTRLKGSEIVLHEKQDIINEHDIAYILSAEHEALARNF